MRSLMQPTQVRDASAGVMEQQWQYGVALPVSPQARKWNALPLQDFYSEGQIRNPIHHHYHCSHEELHGSPFVAKPGDLTVHLVLFPQVHGSLKYHHSNGKMVTYICTGTLTYLLHVQKCFPSLFTLETRERKVYVWLYTSFCIFFS